MRLGKKSVSFTDLPEWVEVGNYSTLAEHCIFHGPDNHGCIENPKRVDTGLGGPMFSKGDIKIGNDVWIGDGVRVLSGVTIGDGAIIGAGAVVSKDIPPYAVVVGNPGEIVKFRFEDIQLGLPFYIIHELLKIEWWYWSEEKVDEVRVEMNDVVSFVKKYRKL